MPFGLAGSGASYNRTHHIGPDAVQFLQQGVGVQLTARGRCTRFGTQAGGKSRRFCGCLASSLPEGQPDKASTQRHKAEAEQALKSLEDSGRIGSEYGEVGSFGKFYRSSCHYHCPLLLWWLTDLLPMLQGFVEFRIGTQPLHLDVDTLNERLKVQGANRMRHAMRPDEAYGMIFSLDNVIVNTRQLQQKAWQKIAQEEGLDLPSMERQIYDVRPERAITEVCTRGAEGTL